MTIAGIWKSWNENIQHPYNSLVTPTSDTETAQIVKTTRSVRVIGTGRSSADIIAGTDTLISLEKMTAIRSFDESSREVTVECGMLLSDLIKFVESKGCAIPCLPDIDCISVGGAITTGTHGTGREGKIMADYIIAMTVIHPDGSIATVTENDKEIGAYRLSVGVLGVITAVTFRCVPIYNLQVREEPVSDSIWLKTWKEEFEKNEFLRVLWLPHTDFGYVIRGNLLPEGQSPERIPAPEFSKHRRTFSRILYKFTPQFPQFTALANKILKSLFFSAKTATYGTLYGATVTKSRGSTLELAEWTIPFSRFDALFAELKTELNSNSNKAYAHIPMDVRFIKKDSAWLSYACEEDTVTIGCVSRIAHEADRYHAFEKVEEIFLKHGGRPHWAKRFKSGSAELKPLFPRWDEFIALRRKIDPDGKFLNAYLKRIFE